MNQQDSSHLQTTPDASSTRFGFDRLIWLALVATIVVVFGISMMKRRGDAPSDRTPAAIASTNTAVPTDDSGEPRRITDFALVDTNGEPFTLANLTGQIWIADFFFKNCRGMCPMVLTRLADLQRAIPEDANVKIVAITVDPTNDSPQALSETAKTYGAKDGRWLFLTGDQHEIIRLANEGFLLPLSEDPSTHSFKLSLVDRTGRIVGYFDGTDEQQVTRLKKKIRELVDAEHREESESPRGASADAARSEAPPSEGSR